MNYRFCGVIFCISLTIHLLNVYFLNKNLPLFKPQPGTDQYFYEQASAAIAGGDIFGKVLGNDKAPAYPYFLAVIRKISGAKNLPSAAGIAQSFIFSLNAVFVFLIAGRLFGGTCALISAGILVLYGPLVLYDTVMLRDSMLIFFDLGMLYFLIEIASAAPLTRKDTRFLANIAAAGIFAGLSFLTKETAVVFIIPALIWLYFQIGRRSNELWESSHFAREASAKCGSPPAQRGKRSLLFAAVFVAVIAPGILRNSLASNNSGIFTEQSGGMVFYCWNSPDSFGHHWACPPAAMDEYQHLTKSGALAVIAGLSKKIIEHPADYLKLYIRKTCAFWWDYEIPNNMNFYLAKQYSPVLKFTFISFAVVGPLGLIGIFLAAFRQNDKRVPLLYLYVLYLIILGLLFTVIDRYRLPVAPALSVFAAYALTVLLEMSLKVRRARDTVAPAIMVLAFIILVVLFRSPIKQKIRINDYMMLAAACGSQGNAPGALEYYRAAASCPPDEYMARLDDSLNGGYRDFYYYMKRKALFCLRR